MKNNRGVTLIELIVVIAIMSVLTGALTPAFMRFVSSRRQTACHENREALLNVYEKCVYGEYITLSKAPTTSYEFDELLNNISNVPADYKSQFDSHNICSNGGTFSFDITIDEEGKALIQCKCSDHNEIEDECSVDIIGWSGEENKVADAPLPFTIHEPEDEPDPPIIPPEPEDEPDDDSGYHGYWPYADHERWNTDETAGYHSDAHIFIDVPSGKFSARSSSGGAKVYYVAVNRNGNNPTYISRAYCEHPEAYVMGAGILQGGSEFLVTCSGVELEVEDYLALIAEYPGNIESPDNFKTEFFKNYDSNDQRKKEYPLFIDYCNANYSGGYAKYCEDNGINPNKEMDFRYNYNKMLTDGQFKVAYGDIIILSDGSRFVYGSSGGGYVKLPKVGDGDKSENWYKLAGKEKDEI